MISIVSAEAKDCELIRNLASTTFHDTYAAYNTPEDMALHIQQYFNLKSIKAELSDVNTLYFIAYINMSPAGFVKMRKSKNPRGLQSSRTIEIERIYVLKAFQKQKIGAALVKHCIDSARQLSCETIWLGVWQQNTAAIGFYERMGFERFGSQQFLLGTNLQTDWLMKLTMNDNKI